MKDKNTLYLDLTEDEFNERQNYKLNFNDKTVECKAILVQDEIVSYFVFYPIEQFQKIESEE